MEMLQILWLASSNKLERQTKFLQSTSDGNRFLIKDSTVREEKFFYLLHLSQALYGTYKTIPNVFYQLYTIHSPIGADNNSRVLTLVYASMTSKVEDVYRQLYQDLNEFVKENNIELTPLTIITYFEKASINTYHSEFPGVNIFSSESKRLAKDSRI
ncbi:hypothetical protein RclHR1_00230032 [Rhizophagus clarus]|uniref:Uncharacterized protein LOC112591534 n=1 Tax=Rhizophagus clarus TaxID=94130 RepID=A0A2Z6R8M4_9GLOM|nr:hypothetical protein RclHR1_00230032 [Rhizophagus clarus]GES72936.1 uncharacterized protein LOC112591534 [Rhizophagus clarus]